MDVTVSASGEALVVLRATLDLDVYGGGQVVLVPAAGVDVEKADASYLLLTAPAAAGGGHSHDIHPES